MDILVFRRAMNAMRHLRIVLAASDEACAEIQKARKQLKTQFKAAEQLSKDLEALNTLKKDKAYARRVLQNHLSVLSKHMFKLNHHNIRDNAYDETLQQIKSTKAIIELLSDKE